MLFLSEKVAATEKEIIEAASARIPRTGIRTVRRRRQARDRAFHPGIEDSVAQDQQESLQGLAEDIGTLG